MRRRAVVAAVLLAGAAAEWVLARPLAEPAATMEARVREADLAFYLARAERDPQGALDLAHAASLLAERGRAGGASPDILRAEALARRALTNQPGQPAALRVLTGVLMSQHRFVEALAAADALVACDSESVGDRALAADIRMELGRYAEAGSALRALRPYASTPTVAVRLARWEELTGAPERARALLLEARRRADSTWGVPASQRAWFALQAGAFALRYERWAEAQRLLEAGLELAPSDPRLLEALARVAREQRRWREVRILARRALGAGSEDPGLLLLLADAAEGERQPERAHALVERAVRAAFAAPGPVHRDVALALLERGLERRAILAQAEADLASRRDIYGWDLYAQALRAVGRLDEARAAMRRALESGSRDPALLRRAAALGAGGVGA